ncbi:Serine/threonine-protein kinase 33 [Pleurostoma richardsiae]|uniref:non-specific serine/threonine protein kinase n=1 Tax=Pleurostoma richardsiae TaxID=41990 RepID=A0AA38RIK7_9PEZI|nr:Serine/threonine-protein kinase 33 [Pleurostoma richardsiae]
MPRPTPHPLALFSLIPINGPAKAVVNNPYNTHLVSWLNNEPVLDIGHTRSVSGDHATLATLGRNGDVTIEGRNIAKLQCSFEIDNETKVVMFYDRSHSQTCQVFGENAKPFDLGRPRKVVVQKGLNTIIGIGGVNRNLIQFELAWHGNPDKTMERVKKREKAALEENPRFARTVDDTDTVPPTGVVTRIHTPGPRLQKIRFERLGPRIGAGQFAEVYRAVNVDTGQLIAAKILKRPVGPAKQREWMTLKREIEIHSSISHDHIVEYLGSQDWDQPETVIFMGLKDGTLESLVENGCSVPIKDLSPTVFHHMLKAIDFLSAQGLIHRDLKPANILYVTDRGRYHFQLGDLGFSHRADLAVTYAGSPIYMAPEIVDGGKQTHKVDVWSLFVTMLWTLDVEGYRAASAAFTSLDEARDAVLLVASSVEAVANIREMARIKPEERASAAQMLVKCFNGVGLTTPGHLVPPISRPKGSSKAPAMNGDNQSPDAASSAPTGRKRGGTATTTGGPLREKTRRPQVQSRQPEPPVPKKHREQGTGAKAPKNSRMPGGFPGN